jgi:hypothetical protein
MKDRGGIRERNGVRIGQRVRDADGKSLGRVDALYESGFSVVKGLPLLFRKDFVAGYEEVLDWRGDEIVIARSSDDLLSLARGELPPSWREASAHRGPAAAKATEAKPSPALSTSPAAGSHAASGSPIRSGSRS